MAKHDLLLTKAKVSFIMDNYLYIHDNLKGTPVELFWGNKGTLSIFIYYISILPSVMVLSCTLSSPNFKQLCFIFFLKTQLFFSDL